MVEVATYVRIFATTPDDDLVEKRTSAVKDLAAKFMKDTHVNQLLATAHLVALAVDAKTPMPGEFAESVQTAVRKTALAFVAKDAELEVTVCGLMASLHVLERAKPGTSILTKEELFALGLWSALGFQPPRAESKLEALRVAVLNAARSVVLKAGHTSRARQPVEDVKTEVPDSADVPTTAKAVEDATNVAIGALRVNAQLDREELDLLWWVVSDWSEVLEQRFEGAPNKASTAIAAGLEAGSKLRRVPIAAHRNLVLRQAAPPADEITLTELIKRLEDDRSKLAASFASDTYPTELPAIFPMLSALRTGTATDAKSRMKRTHSEWAERTLLERSILSIVSLLSKPGK